jgi:hypothetical protein
MKRLVAALAGLVLVPLGAAPAEAATNTIVVPGFRYPASLDYATQDCGDTPYDGTRYAEYRRPGAIGTHASGLSFPGVTGEAGVRTSISTPSALNELTFQTYHALGPTDASPGSFYVIIDPSGSGFQTYYRADVNLNIGFAGWNKWTLTSHAMRWWFWDGDSWVDPMLPNSSIASFASTHGNGSGAIVAYMFGCDGRDYYMDDFRIGVGSDTRVYDFEGVPSETYLSTYETHHSDHLMQDVRKLTLTTRQSHVVAGDSWSLGDSVTGEGWFSGPARLYQKKHGRSSFSLYKQKNFTTTTHAWFTIQPLKNTVYYIDTPGTGTFESSRSLTFAVSVKRRVQMHVADTTIYRGQQVKVNGHIMPRTRGVGVSVQRRTGTGWRTIAKGLTRARGEYSFAPRIMEAGKWKLRVVAAGGKGNLGNKSPSIEVTAKVPPPKPPPPPPPDDDTVITPAGHDLEEPGDDIKGRRMVRQIVERLWGWNLGSSSDSAPASTPPPLTGSTTVVGQRPSS